MSAVEALAELIAGSPSGAIEAIAGALERNELQLTSSSVGIQRIDDVDTRTAQRCAEAFQRVRGAEPAAAALALRTANRLRGIEQLSRPEIEIVWTGPEAEGPLVRPTDVVISEMLRSVRESGEILLVGYSLTADDGSPARAVIDLLGEASRRRAVVTLILHHDEESRNRENLRAAWSAFAVKPRLFTWDPPPDAPYRKLHAKALIVDRLEALVTSANLTYHGLAQNLELGLRVRGLQAAAIALRFDHLIASRTLRKWDE